MIIEKTKIDEIFERNTDPGRCLMALYLLAIPEGVRCEGWPRIGSALHKHLLDQFGRFSEEDRVFWEKFGFTLDKSLDPWEVAAERK